MTDERDDKDFRKIMRSLFAGLALHAILSKPKGVVGKELTDVYQERYAEVAVGYADALIAELEKS